MIKGFGGVGKCKMNWIQAWARNNPTVQYWQQRLALRKLEIVSSVLEQEVQKADGQDVETFKNLLGRIVDCEMKYDRAVLNSAIVPAEIALSRVVYSGKRLCAATGISDELLPQNVTPSSGTSSLDCFEKVQARAEQGRERITRTEQELYKVYGVRT